MWSMMRDITSARHTQCYRSGNTLQTYPKPRWSMRKSDAQGPTGRGSSKLTGEEVIRMQRPGDLHAPCGEVQLGQKTDTEASPKQGNQLSQSQELNRLSRGSSLRRCWSPGRNLSRGRTCQGGTHRPERMGESSTHSKEATHP